MVDELANKWSKLNMTTADDEVIDFKIDLSEDVDAQVLLCLVGELTRKTLLTQKH